MAKPKRVLWLVSEPGPAYQAKKQLLEKHNHRVTWVHSLSELRRAIAKQRAHAIVISEGIRPAYVCDQILGLCSLTEAKGSRWILTLKDHDTKVIKFAAGSNFRDLIPLNLPDKQWIFRFLYATAGKALDYPLPPGQITVNHRAELRLPFRLIWLSKERLRFESHLVPPPGSRLKLTGACFDVDEGGSEVCMVVEKIDHSGLSYRFSTAIEGSWEAEGGSRLRVLQALARFQQRPLRPRYRIFIAAKNQLLRRQLFTQLSGDNFEISSALHLRSLIEEPLFFGPDLVIVEAAFTRLPYSQHFHDMLARLAADVPILLVMPAASRELDVHTQPTGRRITPVADISPSFLQLVKDHLPNAATLATRQEKGAVYFEHDNRTAFGSLVVAGKLTKIHPLVTELALPYRVKNFALCQLETPLLSKWLGKAPWIKVTRLHRAAQAEELGYPYTAAAFFADLPASDERSLAVHLGRLIAKVLGFTSGLTGPTPVSLTLGAGDTPPPRTEAAEPRGRRAEALPARLERSLASARSVPARAAASLGEPPLKLATSLTLRYLLIFFVVSALTLLLVLQIVPAIANHYTKSGSAFVEQLHRFSNKKSSDSE